MTLLVLLWLAVSLVLSVFLVFCLAWWLRKRARARSLSLPQESGITVLPTEICPVPIPQEIYSDKDGFALLGAQWSWLRNTPVSYGCSECSVWINTDSRDYLHVPSGYTFTVLRHKCPTGLKTTPMAAILNIPKQPRLPGIAKGGQML
jgi:hypothetical protein